MTNSQIREQYFSDICSVLLDIGIDEDRIEASAQDIMDVWTDKDGVLDTESIDEKLAAWLNYVV